MKFKRLLETSKVILKPDEVKDFEVFARVRDGLNPCNWIYIMMSDGYWIPREYNGSEFVDVFCDSIQPSTNPKRVLVGISKKFKYPETEYIKSQCQEN